MAGNEVVKRRRLSRVVLIAFVIGAIGAWAAAVPESQVEVLPLSGFIPA